MLTKIITLDLNKKNVDQFILNLEHEITAPLSIISALLSGLAYSAYLTEEDKKLLNFAIATSERANHTLKTIPLHNRLQVHGWETIPQRYYGYQLYTGLKEYGEVAQRRYFDLNVQFTTTIEEALIKRELIVDHVGLLRAYDLVIDNAFKFSRPTGLVRVSLASAAQDDQYYIDIIDQGVGISTQVQECIFDAYTQDLSAKTRAKRVLGGFGLGLSNARTILRALGGDIELCNTSELGSWFRIIFTARMVS